MSQPTNSTSSTPTNDKADISKWKDEFNMEIMKLKNDSSNNPLFTSDRYEQVIISITEAKQKCYADRTKKEINLLKTYDIVRFGDRPKLVRKKSATTEGLAKYYVSFNELFDVIYETHITIGHRGILNTMKELKKKYVNVTEKQVTLFISGCEECKRKRSKPKNSCKLIVQPVISNDFNARGQVDLVDMQSCPDGLFKFILNYQDHFTKFCFLRPLKTKTAAEVAYQLLDIFTIIGAPAILQSDNGREFVAKVIEELAEMWAGLKIVHGRARHPQSQGSVERCNQDVKLLTGTWMRENNSKKWSQALRFVQFQKNSCHHRVIQHSPYSVLFGQEPKIGLSSTALHPSIFNVITSEEELLKKLGLPLTDEDETGETEHAWEIEENHSDDIQGGETANVDHKEETISPIGRAHRRNKNQQDAREGQKRQGDQFLQNTENKRLLDNLNVGDNVLVPIPDVDRGPADARNVLAVIMDVKYGKYHLGTAHGVLHGFYAYNQISKAPGSPTLLVEDIPNEVPKSLREIARLQSVTGGQGMFKCDCKGGCKTKRCKCKQANVLCNSRCHSSLTCDNKL